VDDLQKNVVNKISKYLGEGRDYVGFCSFAFEWLKLLNDSKNTAGSAEQHETFLGYDDEISVWKELNQSIISSFGEEGSMTLETFLQELDMRSKEQAPLPNSVSLMTIHAAKGKEFKHVYLIGMAEDELPSFQSKKKGDQSPEMEEERRNCFVAITRTIETLTLSYAKKYREWPKKPSRFLREMELIYNGL
jgi:DNA helicase-2/ATP-dependent DNA helicase PcrA